MEVGRFELKTDGWKLEDLLGKSQMVALDDLG